MLNKQVQGSHGILPDLPCELLRRCTHLLAYAITTLCKWLYEGRNACISLQAQMQAAYLNNKNSFAKENIDIGLSVNYLLSLI